MNKLLYIGPNKLQLMKSHNTPDFRSKVVYADSVFKYVELWFSRKKQKYDKSIYYWQQAHAFYEASCQLPISARPLTAYYCCMNATKALLAMNADISLTNISHGVSSARMSQIVNLQDCEIRLSNAGVYGELAKIIEGHNLSQEKYNVKELLYNIPCVHRTFCLTHSKQTELYIHINPIGFVCSNDMHKRLSFEFTIEKERFPRLQTHSLPLIFERIPENLTDNTRYYHFRTKRVNNCKWNIHRPLTERLNNLTRYYKKIRPYFQYVVGDDLYWYVKKALPVTQTINRSPILLIYAALHWLSELVRYNPEIFEYYMNSSENWLFTDVVDHGLRQFIDEISSEITGANIMRSSFI